MNIFKLKKEKTKVEKQLDTIRSIQNDFDKQIIVLKNQMDEIKNNQKTLIGFQKQNKTIIKKAKLKRRRFLQSLVFLIVSIIVLDYFNDNLIYSFIQYLVNNFF